MEPQTGPTAMGHEISGANVRVAHWEENGASLEKMVHDLAHEFKPIR